MRSYFLHEVKGNVIDCLDNPTRVTPIVADLLTGMSDDACQDMMDGTTVSFVGFGELLGTLVKCLGDKERAVPLLACRDLVGDEAAESLDAGFMTPCKLAAMRYLSVHNKKACTGCLGTGRPPDPTQLAQGALRFTGCADSLTGK